MGSRTYAEESAHHYGTEREKSLAKDNADLTARAEGADDELGVANEMIATLTAERDDLSKESDAAMTQATKQRDRAKCAETERDTLKAEVTKHKKRCASIALRVGAERDKNKALMRVAGRLFAWAGETLDETEGDHAQDDWHEQGRALINGGE